MCPACLATLAMIVAGTTSTGGLAAVVVTKFRTGTGAKLRVAISKMKGKETKEKAS
jgi:hypothetical protein